MTTKAKILPSELAKFMGLKKGQAKQLKPYCEAAKDICNAFAAADLDELPAGPADLHRTRRLNRLH